MSHSRAPGGSALGAGAESARLAREARELDGRDWASSGVRAVPAADSLRSFAAELAGPLGTPYEGGVWKLTVALPAAYPFEPPAVRFVTPIWHPNVSSETGAICLDILKKAWTPAMTIKTALLSIGAHMRAGPARRAPRAAPAPLLLLPPPSRRRWTVSGPSRHKLNFSCFSVPRGGRRRLGVQGCRSGRQCPCDFPCGT